LIAEAVEATHAIDAAASTAQASVHIDKIKFAKRTFFNEQKNWWNQSREHAEAASNFNVFLRN